MTANIHGEGYVMPIVIVCKLCEWTLTLTKKPPDW